MRIVLKRNAAGRWYWHLVGGNGEVMAHSQSYSRRWSARRSARKVAGHFADTIEVVEA